MAGIGHVIRTRRLALGLTQADLAAQLGDGVRQLEISRIESGVVGLSSGGTLDRLATALGFSPEQLLAGTGWPDTEAGVPSDASQNGFVAPTAAGRDMGASFLDQALALAHGLAQTLEALRQEMSEAPARDQALQDGSADSLGATQLPPGQ